MFNPDLISKFAISGVVIYLILWVIFEFFIIRKPNKDDILKLDQDDKTEITQKDQ